MAREDRFHFLMTMLNKVALNEISKDNGYEAYEEVYGSHYIPNFIYNTTLLCKLYVWLVVFLFPIIVAVHFICVCFETIVAKKIKYNGDRIFLLASFALPRVIENAGINVRDDKWISIPRAKWVKNISVDKEKILNVYNLISIHDVFNSFIDSLLIEFYTAYKYGYRFALMNIHSFYWLLYDKAIRLIPENVELVFANHKDEYSTLIDELPHEKKKLIQHGTEILMHGPQNPNSRYIEYNDQTGYWNQVIPYKYKTVTDLVCFSHKEELALKRAILDCNPKVEIVGYSLKGFNENLEGKKAVLIIGYYSLFYNKERKLIELLQNRGVIIFLKNHPAFASEVYDPLIKEYTFTLLNGPRFPKVDVVFSYSSTLALEYESLGARIVLYDELDDDNLRAVVCDELSRINVE